MIRQNEIPVMKIGIISLGGESSLSLAENCKKYFDDVDSLDLRHFEIRLTNEGIKVIYLKEDLTEYDCLYVRGSHKYGLIQRAITRELSKKVYMPIASKAFTLGHDKFLTLIELQKNGVPIPKTHYAATTKFAKKLLEEIHYPVIMKIPSGTHGKGVMIAESKKSANAILDMLDDFKRPYIIQEFVPTENTSDIRAIVVGGEVIASYERIANDGDFRANIHAGGTRKSHELTKEERKLAIKSAKAIRAEICGVDILNSKQPSVIEVNLSPSLHSVKEVSGVDVLDSISKFLYEKTVRFKERKEKKLKDKMEKKNVMNGNGDVNGNTTGVI